MPVDRDRMYLVLFSVYVTILVVATIGELCDIDAILKRLLAQPPTQPS